MDTWRSTQCCVPEARHLSHVHSSQQEPATGKTSSAYLELHLEAAEEALVVELLGLHLLMWQGLTGKVTLPA